MNKRLISEIKSNDIIVRRFAQDFNPQDVKIKYLDFNANEMKEGQDEQVRSFQFEIQILNSDIDPFMIRKVILPVLDYALNVPIFVTVEYEEIV